MRYIISKYYYNRNTPRCQSRNFGNFSVKRACCLRWCDATRGVLQEIRATKNCFLKFLNEAKSFA